MSRDKGSGYRTYIFEESTRRYTIDRKGRGHKEIIYLHVADVSCTRGVRESTGLSYRGPCGGVPWQINNLKTKFFKNKEIEEGVGITDFINRIV